MSKASKYILVPIAKEPGWKQLQLPASYLVNVYDKFARRLGTGNMINVKVDPMGHSYVRIGTMTMPSPPDLKSKYMVEIKLDDGNLYLECIMQRNSVIAGMQYRIELTSNQPPKTWLNR